VNLYDFRANGLVEVRRPKGKFDAEIAQEEFDQNLKGLPYGWGDDLFDVSIPIGTKGVNCSHCASLVQDYGGTPQFCDHFDRSEVTPRDFCLSRESFVVWQK